MPGVTDIPKEAPAKGAQHYLTPFGVIKKGESQTQVKQILGNPHHARTTKNGAVWYYYFGPQHRFFVYFVEGRVDELTTE